MKMEIIAGFWLLLSALAANAGPGDPPSRQDDGVIDVHAHIGQYKGRGCSPEAMLAHIEAFGLAKALVSNIAGATGSSEHETNLETVGWVRAHPTRLKGILWALPTRSDPGLIEKFLKDDAYRDVFVAIGLFPAFNGYAVDFPMAVAYLELCEKYRIPAFYPCGPSGSGADPRAIYRIAKNFPRVKILISPSSLLGRADNLIATVRESRLQGDAELYLGTANMELDDVLAAVRDLGADRVLFGTEACFHDEDSYGQYQALVADLKRRLSAADFAKLTRENAIALFGL